MRRRTSRISRVGLILGAVAIALMAAAPVGAQGDDQGENLAIRAVDGRNPDVVEVEFFYDGPRENVPDLVVRENGEVVTSTTPVRLDDSEQFGIVLAIDTSGSMEKNAAFERAIDASKEFIENKEADDEVAIVSFSDTAQIVQRFTADEAVLVDALDRLGPEGPTVLYDAVRDSVNLFQGTDLVPNILVVTDGQDSGSPTSPEVAAALLDDANALLFAIGIESDDLDVGALERLAEPTGGSVLQSDDPRDLADLYIEVQDQIRRQYRTTIVSETEASGPSSLTLTIGNTTTTGSFTPGARLDSASQVEPVEVPARTGIESLQSETFLWVGFLLLLLAVAAAVYAVASSIVRENRRLDRVLQPYSDGYVAAGDDDGERMATSAILQRAVEMTGDFAERRGFLERVEDRLEQANLPLRAAEALFFYLVGALLVGLIGGLLAGSLVAGLIVLLLALLIPPALLNFLAFRRRKEFQAQLPDMLALLASTLRSGYSLMQGVEAAAKEVEEPMRKELQRVVTEARLGMPLEQALEGVALRLKSRDFAWATMAIGIQREVGGNLAEVLDTVAETMTARERLRRDISSLTAEGRVSAMVLGALPVLIGAAIMVLNPGYMDALFDETLGVIMLVGSGLLMVFGFWWMYKLIDIEV
jgi:tight adherence protein B